MISVKDIKMRTVNSPILVGIKMTNNDNTNNFMVKECSVSLVDVTGDGLLPTGRTKKRRMALSSVSANVSGDESPGSADSSGPSLSRVSSRSSLVTRLTPAASRSSSTNRGSTASDEIKGRAA